MTLKARITAIDRFITGCREDGIYDDLNACCVMAGWDSLAGALTPLKGAAPTNNGLSVYDRGIGIAGDGSSAYLDSNRNNTADPQNDNHNAVFVSSPPTSASAYIAAGSSGGQQNGSNNLGVTDGVFCRNRSGTPLVSLGSASADGLVAVSRSSAAAITTRISGESTTSSLASQSPLSEEVTVFARRSGASVDFYSDATIAFFSIGPATDLALLDARVSTLMADLRAIEETGFDRDAIAYIRAVEEADGAFLETDVKVAVNNLVSGLKADGLWESMASTCLLCGPRTLAGALVPLRGDAPTPNGFVSGDYSRTDGLRDPGGTSLLDTNRSTTDDPQDDVHLAAYLTALPTVGGGLVAAYYAGPPVNGTQVSMDGAGLFFTRCRNANEHRTTALATGFAGLSRSAPDAYSKRNSGSTASVSAASATPPSINYAVFSNDTSGAGVTDPTIAFYSIGSSVDLAKMDSHISSYVTAIGAAI